MREIYEWPYAAFEIPDAVREAWRAIGARGRAAREAWEGRLAALSDARRAEFERVTAGAVSPKLGRALAAFRREQAAAAPKIATRKASEMVLEVVNAALPETIGGSADLTGSNNTKTKGLEVLRRRTAAGATSTTGSASTAWPRR